MPFDNAEGIQMGRDFVKIQDTDEWKSLAKLATELRRKWTYSLLRMESDDIYKIALQRMKWVSMVNGLDTFFDDIENSIEMFKTAEKEAQNRERKLN